MLICSIVHISRILPVFFGSIFFLRLFISATSPFPNLLLHNRSQVNAFFFLTSRSLYLTADPVYWVTDVVQSTFGV